MLLQYILAGLLITLAAVYCIRKLIRIVQGKEKTSCAFCDHCPGAPPCKDKKADSSDENDHC